MYGSAINARSQLMANKVEKVDAIKVGNLKKKVGIKQYIILKDGILRSNWLANSYNITSKRGVYFTVHSLGSIRTNC